MKDIRNRLIDLLKEGHCTPQISSIAKKLNEPSTTIHYNIKKLEQEKAIKTYKAVFDSDKIDQSFCAVTLVSLAPSEYRDPEKIAREVATHKEVESVDICTGDWEMVIKVRTKNQDEFYKFLRDVLGREGIAKVKSLTSLKQIKTESIFK